jgi:hypothetical protein
LSGQPGNSAARKTPLRCIADNTGTLAQESPLLRAEQDPPMACTIQRVLKRYSIVGFLFLAIACPCLGQPTDRDGSRFLSFSADYLELKDQLNHGFVFRGPDVSLWVGMRRDVGSGWLDYSFRLSGGGKTALGTWGFRWAVAPVNIAYLATVYAKDGAVLSVGPSIRAEYDIQNYPDLHTGLLNWVTSYAIGIRIVAGAEIRSRGVRAELEADLAGAVSRPALDRDPQLFSLRPGDILRNAHDGLRFVQPTDFLRTSISIGTAVGRAGFLDYRFVFVGFFDRPSYRQLSHGLQYQRFFRRRRK